MHTPELREAVVASSDLTAYARYAATQSDEDLFSFIADYYRFVGALVEEAGGTVIKFIGDATLLIYPAGDEDAAVLNLLALSARGDRWLAERQVSCRHQLKAHFGRFACGPVGVAGQERLDVFGTTINTVFLMKAQGFAISPQLFRKLGSDTRKHFKKHTPPITYIPVEEAHRD